MDRLTAAAHALKGSVRYETPNNSLYTFVGTMDLSLPGGQTKTVPLGPSQVMLRGCMLRSCHHIFGLVIFTGNDTKLMQNSRPAPSKQSHVYRTVNRLIVLIFATQAVLCITSVIMFGVWSGEKAGTVDGAPKLW